MKMWNKNVGTHRLWGTAVAALLVLAQPSVAAEKTISLDQAFQKVVDTTDLMAELYQLEAKLNALLLAPEAAYDGKLYGSFTYRHDRSRANVDFDGPSSNYLLGEGGYKKLFKSGTFLDVSLGYNWQKNEEVEQTGPEYYQTPAWGAFTEEVAFDGDTGQTRKVATGEIVDPIGYTVQPRQQQSFIASNPANELVLAATVSQSLTKNFLSKQIKVQKEILAANSPSTKLAKNLELLGMLSATENLYVEVQAIDARIEVLRRGIALLDEMEAITARKVRQGRSEEKELMSINVNRISQQHAIENLQAVRRNLEIQMRDLMRIPLDQKFVFESIDYSRLPTPQSLPTIVDFAKRNRKDIALEKQNIVHADLQIKKAEIEALPDISVFASASLNGLQDDFAGAVTDFFGSLQQGETDTNGPNMQFNLGIQGEWTIGKNRALESARLQAEADKNISAIKIARLERDIEKNVTSAWQSWRNSLRLLNVLQKKVSSLEELIAEEERLYRISRGDAALVLQRKQELVAAENERIDAYIEMRKARSAIRFAMHDYPVTLPQQ